MSWICEAGCEAGGSKVCYCFFLAPLALPAIACLVYLLGGGIYRRQIQKHGRPKNKASDHKFDDVKKIQSHDSYYMLLVDNIFG